MIDVATVVSPFAPGDLVRPKDSAEPGVITEITEHGAHMVSCGGERPLPYGPDELEKDCLDAN